MTSQNIIEQPKPSYGTVTHEDITKLINVSNAPLNENLVVYAPTGQNPFWSTRIKPTDTPESILRDHINDPDSFSILGKHQEEHSAIVDSNLGYAPYMSQYFINLSIQEQDIAKKYLYLSWGLHFVEDCGMPWHTTTNLTYQSTHFALEDYIDSKAEVYAEAIKNVPAKNITNVNSACWDLAKFVSVSTKPIYDAYINKDYATVDSLNIINLKETYSVIKGILQNFDTMQVQENKVPEIPIFASIIVFTVIAVTVYLFVKATK